jgi:hypothetical protein
MRRGSTLRALGGSFWRGKNARSASGRERGARWDWAERCAERSAKRRADRLAAFFGRRARLSARRPSGREHGGGGAPRERASEPIRLRGAPAGTDDAVANSGSSLRDAAVPRGSARPGGAGKRLTTSATRTASTELGACYAGGKGLGRGGVGCGAPAWILSAFSGACAGSRVAQAFSFPNWRARAVAEGG